MPNRPKYARAIRSAVLGLCEGQQAFVLRDEQIMTHLNTAMGAAQLGDIGALQIERYKLDRLKQSASPATVNREVALLKHLFNMAEVWQLFCGRNPVRGVKFLEEDNLQVRSLSEAEEEQLLQCCSPYLQDMVTFAINTGLRLGEILNLRWEEVDLEHAVIKMLVRKSRRMLEVPLNDEAVAVINGCVAYANVNTFSTTPRRADNGKTFGSA